MKAKSLVLAVVAALVAMPSMAQGVVVFKKSGERVAFQYEEIDSIVPYNSDAPIVGRNKVYTVNGVSFTMIPVEGGSFTMGATSEQSNGYTPASNETPTHGVTLSSFYMAETEVTQALWYAVMGQKPTSGGSQWSSSCGLGDNFPAYYVSYTDCQEFITKLNGLTGQAFRMPTEAEWEYAARGGKKSKGYVFSGSNSIADVAYTGNSGSATHAVKTKAANELGLYDMSGNVWEWCSDWYGSYGSSNETDPKGPSTGSNRVLRGGSWSRNAIYCRVSSRNNFSPGVRSNFYGLRLVSY